MLFAGLTGAIGSGKSEALAAFSRLGAAVLSSDDIVHELLETDELRDMLVGRWGARVAPEGTVDRACVAELVFGRPQELAWLEQVLFPRVGERMAAWRLELERGGHAPEVAVVEVPLLFEAGIEGAFDATIAVVVDDAVRRRRAAGRDQHGLTERAARQLSQAEKAARADHVLRNDGTLEELERAAGEVLSALERRAAG